MGFPYHLRAWLCSTWKEITRMNSTGKFLVSALLIHAANLKKLSDTQQLIQIPLSVVPSPDSAASPMGEHK